MLRRLSHWLKLSFCNCSMSIVFPAMLDFMLTQQNEKLKDVDLMVSSKAPFGQNILFVTNR